jgi:hypothetical protein
MMLLMVQTTGPKKGRGIKGKKRKRKREGKEIHH